MLNIPVGPRGRPISSVCVKFRLRFYRPRASHDEKCEMWPLAPLFFLFFSSLLFSFTVAVAAFLTLCSFVCFFPVLPMCRLCAPTIAKQGTLNAPDQVLRRAVGYSMPAFGPKARRLPISRPGDQQDLDCGEGRGTRGLD